MLFNAVTGFDLLDLDTGSYLSTFIDTKHPIANIDSQKIIESSGCGLPAIFVHNGRALLGGSYFGRVHLWDVQSKRPIQILRHAGMFFAQHKDPR